MFSRQVSKLVSSLLISKVNSQQTAWIFHEEPNPTEVVPVRSKWSFVIYLKKKTRNITTIPLYRTFNLELYTNISLPEIF